MNKTIGWSIVGAIVIIASLIVGVPHLMSQAPATDDASVATTSAEVAPRPDCPLREVHGVELECLGGTVKEGTKDTDQHKTLVNVWAWWCEPCRAELPVLERYADNHPDYDVVGVHADGNAANGAAFLNDVGVELPSYQDDSNAFAGTLGLPGVVPITVVFRDGQKVGALAKAFETEEELARAVEEVLAGNA